ncbi:MAG: hypothetical protein M3O15_15910 [Acidobacteriota bacterium]|nr:hypothetical protein [Acidobacteriota bacterium]
MDIRREILRNIILCQALAPTGRRAGGKWREQMPEGPKLEHLIVAGVNSSWQFYDLADRVLTAGRQPDSIFDLAYEAQKASLRNLSADRVNFRPVQLLVPLVTAQVLDYMETGTHEDVESMIERTGEVLRNSTERDVESFIHLGHVTPARQSARFDRTSARSEPVPARRGRYRSVWEAAQDFQAVHSVREMIDGYPFSQQVYRFLLHNVESGILPATELIYQFLFPEIGRADVTADLIVVGLYLMLTKHPEGLLFI